MIREALRAAAWRVVARDGAEYTEHAETDTRLRLTRAWDGDVCRAALTNEGAAPVAVREIVLFDCALDLPPETGLARARGRSVADRMEAESLEFHQRVRQTFRALAESDPDRYLVLDARQGADELAAAIRVRVTDLLSGLPLQTLPQQAGRHAQPTTPVQRHPHAQTGATPQLHP